MKKVFLLLILVLFSGSSHSQSTWFWQQPLPTGNFLYSVDFLNENTGYAVGVLGTVMKTTNGGVNWSLCPLQPQEQVAGVAVIDPFTVVVSGNNFYRTTNSGENWSIVYSTSFQGSCYLTFPTDLIGYGVSGIGRIIKTTNSGLNWVEQVSPVQQGFLDISFCDSLHGIIASSRGVLMTSNGGLNWNYHDLNLMQFDVMASCSIADSLNAYAVNAIQGKLYVTTNSGTSWNSFVLPIDQTGDIPRSCSFSKMDYGFVVTSFGDIVKTSTGGQSWIVNSEFNPTGHLINVLWDVHAFDTNNVFVCGSGGKVIKTTNAGLNWTLTTGGRYNLESNYFTNEMTGYSVGFKGTVLKTTNAGLNWIAQQSNTTQNLNDVFFVNEDVGYVCGDTGVVLKTINGGTNWTQTVTEVNDILKGIYFHTFDFGICCGRNGTVLRTTNGGFNWHSQIIQANGYAESVFLIDSNEGFVSTESDLFKTTNGGLNWNLYSVGGGNKLLFLNHYTGYNAAGAGIITKTTNGGLNWFAQNGNVTGVINSIFFLDQNNGFAVGREGCITKTTNGGILWTAQERITFNTLESVFFTDNNTGYITGEFGTMLKTTNGGLTFVNPTSQDVVDGYSLSQNYPNPFNSSTIIKYHIPKPALVKIILYNIEGKEIQTLTNKFHSKGSYELYLNSLQLSTGVYFYSLSIDSKSLAAKKLIVLK